ncbi:hypothetical protein BGX33_001700 [Mortierella sp. NVP41]|nr:hypothetical protein BGX33_001700 [Mortierella sp. NVP41]
MQDQDLLDRLPGLSNLITDLNTRFLTPTGTSLHLDQDLHQARYALKHKKSYLETKTLFESVDRLRFLPLDNHHLSCSGSANALSYQAADLQRDISTHLDRLLSILETRRLVLASPTTANPSTRKDSRGSSTSNTTNGPGTDMSPSIVEILASRNKNHDHDAHIDLDEFVVDQLRPHLDALEGVSPFMIRTIHQSVQQRRQDVLSLYNNGITTTLDKDPTKNRANSFEDLIAQTKKQAVFLDRCKEDAVLHDLVVQNKTRKLFETMNQTVTTLWEVILEFKIRYQLDQDQTFREYFTQLVESLALKLE